MGNREANPQDHYAMLLAGRIERTRSAGDAVLGHIAHAHLGTMEGIRPLLVQKRGSMTF